jgi:hypothetical protein
MFAILQIALEFLRNQQKVSENSCRTRRNKRYDSTSFLAVTIVGRLTS